jgi:hypothetical protein
MINAKKEILKYLESGNSITPLEALKLFRCMRLGARINEYRKEGYDIKTKIIESEGKRYARYTLVTTPVAAHGGTPPEAYRVQR